MNTRLHNFLYRVKTTAQTKLKSFLKPFKKPKRIYSMTFKSTIAKGARKAGMGISEYVEKNWNMVGTSQQTIDEISKIVNFNNVTTVCDIGPGTGRHLEKLKKKIPNLKKYFIYEVAEDWAQWLEKEYNVTRREANGHDLHYEADNSCDYIQSIGVMVYISFINQCKYFKEMARVLKPGGHLVFDIMSESVFTKDELNKWINSDHSFPIFTSEKFTESFLNDLGLVLVSTFNIRLGAGHSHFMIFQKK